MRTWNSRQWRTGLKRSQSITRGVHKRVAWKVLEIDFVSKTRIPLFFFFSVPFSISFLFEKIVTENFMDWPSRLENSWKTAQILLQNYNFNLFLWIFAIENFLTPTVIYSIINGGRGVMERNRDRKIFSCCRSQQLTESKKTKCNPPPPPKKKNQIVFSLFLSTVSFIFSLWKTSKTGK